MTPRQSSGLVRDSPFSTTLTCGCGESSCSGEFVSGCEARAGATNSLASENVRMTTYAMNEPCRADLVVCLMVSICGISCGKNMGDGLTPEGALQAAWP